ncbi:MAG: hypothetical protein Q9181_007228 [Wetmoreana brouardii]
MRALAIVGALLSLTVSASAIPASNYIPTAITQEAAETDSPDSPQTPFNRRFPVPNSNTLLHIGPGSKVEATSLRMLLDRAQQELNFLIAKYGPYGVPGSEKAPNYSYFTTTPAGAECFFFISALVPNGSTYGLMDEVLAGLKIFLLDQSRFEQVVFDVENEHRMKGFGGLSIGRPALRSNTSITDNPANLTGIVDLDITLRCTYGQSLDSSAIGQVLGVARMKAMTMIGKEGPRGLLPGESGDWDADGQSGAAFHIQGLPPHHLTWVMMQGAVQALRVILIVDKVPREAKCTMTVAREVMGVVVVKKHEDSLVVDTQ